MVFTFPLTKRGDFAFFIIVFSRVFQGQKKIVFTFPLTKRGDFANEKRRFRVFNNPLTLPLTSLTSGLCIRGRIYFRQGWGWGEGRRRRQRGACPRRGGRHGMASLRGLPLAESALRTAEAARPTAGRFQRIFGEMFGVRHVRQQDAPRVCSSRGGGGASDSRELPEDFRRNVRRTARPTERRSQSIPVTRMRWSVTPTQHAACACDV